MDFAPPPPPFGLDLATVHSMVALTFFVQSLVIGFHAPLSRRYEGIKTFLVSALVLAFGSLVLVLQIGGPHGPLGLLSNELLLVGSALQYVAVSRFVGRREHSGLLWGWTAAGSAYLVMLLLGPPPPFLPIREILPVPMLFAAAVTILRSDTRGFRSGAILTALPFAGYALRSFYWFVAGVLDPTLRMPGPHIDHAIDALLFFVLSFLWTSGFLLMVNQRLQTALLDLATSDPLTGCLNRRAMAAHLEDENLRSQRYGHPYTVILLDLDRFKSINDTKGHHVGDRVLVGTAQTLQSGLRAGDSLARWGGEEFLILLPETGEDEGMALAERLRAALEERKLEAPVTLSAGVAGSFDGATVDQICQRADKALYEAKRERNRVVRAS